MKKKISTVILILAILTGLSLLLYPTVSDYWNSLHQSRAVAAYVEQVSNMNDEEYERILEEAKNYNATLKNRTGALTLNSEELALYQQMLSFDNNGMMGYVEIPSIDCRLPIYHGTDVSVLQIGVGHIEGSSLPVGGESTHCVISGHRGLPSAKLFTNLDKLSVGDIFTLNILDETLTYEVDQILIVDPDDVSALQVIEGEDLCTLVTCTPYGINSHRLLVRGHRTANIESTESVRITADAIQIDSVIVAPFIGIPVLTIMLICVLRRSKKKRPNPPGKE